MLRIIHNNEQVALHTISHEVGKYVTKRFHMPDFKVYSQTEYQARFEARFAAMGESAHEYFQMLIDEKVSYWFRIVRSILGLQTDYGDEAVNLTLKRALYYKAIDLVTIRNILEKKLYLQTVEPRLVTPSLPLAEQTGLFRDLRYYTQKEAV